MFFVFLLQVPRRRLKLKSIELWYVDLPVFSLTRLSKGKNINEQISVDFFHNSRLIRLTQQKNKLQKIQRLDQGLNPDCLLSNQPF